MGKELFNVAIKEKDSDDYTGHYRVLSVVPCVDFARKGFYYCDCQLLVVTPDKKLRTVSSCDCLFLGF